jgi:hypothetical protein
MSNIIAPLIPLFPVSQVIGHSGPQLPAHGTGGDPSGAPMGGSGLDGLDGVPSDDSVRHLN